MHDHPPRRHVKPSVFPGHAEVTVVKEDGRYWKKTAFCVRFHNKPDEFADPLSSIRRPKMERSCARGSRSGSFRK